MKGLKSCDLLHDTITSQNTVAADVDRDFALGLRPFDLGMTGILFFDDLAGIGNQYEAGFGQFNMTRITDEQSSADLFFQCDDMPGKGGFGDKKRFGRRSIVSDFSQHHELT